MSNLDPRNIRNIFNLERDIRVTLPNGELYIDETAMFNLEDEFIKLGRELEEADLREGQDLPENLNKRINKIVKGEPFKTFYAVYEYAKANHWLDNNAPIGLLDAKDFIQIARKLEAEKNISVTEFNEKQWDLLRKRLARLARELHLQGVVKPSKRHDVLPQSTVTKFFKEFLQYGKSPTFRGTVTDLGPSMLEPTKRLIEVKNEFLYLEVTVEHMERIGVKQDENVRKLFNFIIGKANEQNKNPQINFELEELVELGLYADERYAYAGVKNFFSKMMSIQIKGVQWAGVGKRKREIRARGVQLIMKYDLREAGTSFVVMDPEVIDMFMLYYNLFPKWAYSIDNNKAYALIDHIYYIAHQRKQDVTATGKFNISFENIRQVLNLPSPHDTQKHTEKIIDPLLNAIDEIENEAFKQRQEVLKITPIYNHDYKNATDFIANGYIEIEIDDTTRQYISLRQEDKQKKIADTNRKVSAAKKKILEQQLMKKYEAGEIQL